MSSSDVESARSTFITTSASNKQSCRASFLAIGVAVAVGAITALQPLGILANNSYRLGVSCVVALFLGLAVVFLARWFWYGALESHAPSTSLIKNMILSHGVIVANGTVQSQVTQQIVDHVRAVVKRRELFLIRCWLVALGDTGETPRLVVVCAIISLITYIASLLLLLQLKS